MKVQTRTQFFSELPQAYEKAELEPEQAADKIIQFVEDFKEDDEIMSELYDFISDEFVVFEV